jgi:hypothetical protein
LRRGAGRSLIVLLLVGGLAGTVWAARRHSSAASPGIGDVVQVGAPDGTSIPGYLADSRHRLAALPSSTPAMYALVSLAGYQAPAGLAALLAGVEVFRVFARVPLPDTQTEIVMMPVDHLPADVTAGMDAEAAQKSAQATRDGDPVAAAEATGYRQHCACVYAAMVHGTVSELSVLSGRPGVRAVDPAPAVRQLDHTVFRPPLPEQTQLVRPPVDGGPTPGASLGAG